MIVETGKPSRVSTFRIEIISTLKIFNLANSRLSLAVIFLSALLVEGENGPYAFRVWFRQPQYHVSPDVDLLRTLDGSACCVCSARCAVGVVFALCHVLHVPENIDTEQHNKTSSMSWTFENRKHYCNLLTNKSITRMTRSLHQRQQQLLHRLALHHQQEL